MQQFPQSGGAESCYRQPGVDSETEPQFGLDSLCHVTLLFRRQGEADIRWFAVFYDHIPREGNHLATDEQVGQSICSRLDAAGNLATRMKIVKENGKRNLFLRAKIAGVKNGVEG